MNPILSENAIQQRCLDFTRANNNSTKNDLSPLADVLNVVKTNFDKDKEQSLFFGFVEFGEIFKDEMTKLPSVLNHGKAEQSYFISINLDKIRNLDAFEEFTHEIVSMSVTSEKANNLYIALYSKYANEVESSSMRVNGTISQMIKQHKSSLGTIS